MKECRRLIQRHWPPGWRGTALTIVGALVLLLSGTAVAQGIVARIQADLVNGGGGARASPNFLVEDGLQFSGLAPIVPQLFTLSGVVREANRPIAEVSIFDDTGRMTTTDADGRYSLSNLPRGTYVLTAVKTGYTFDGNFRAVNLVANIEENFDASAQDAFENDDTCAQAKAIDPNGTVQAHTFHQTNDEDWVKFDAIAGMRYQIVGNIPISSTADVSLEIYAGCDVPTLGGQDVTFSPGVRFEYTPTTDTPLFLKMINAALTTGSTAAYEISVRTNSPMGSGGDVAILVAGKLKHNDPLQHNIHNATEMFYSFLITHGYDDNHIQYLADDLSVPNSDAIATRAAFHDAIAVWAPARLAADGMLTIYLMDHGDPEVFYLDKTQDELLSPADLNSWLTDLENGLPDLKVNIFIEACYSGSFIGLPAPNTISKPNRVVIASASDEQLARASALGATFSDQFIPALFQGISFYNSFQTARWAVQSAHGNTQVPWLDDDGDGLANGPNDGKLAQTRGFGSSGSLADSFAPYISTISHTFDTSTRLVTVSTIVTGNIEPSRVWATIYDPSYGIGPSSSEMLPDSALTVTLPSIGNATFSGPLGMFNRIGLYRVVVHAQDVNGLRAQPVSFDVRTGWVVYLPQITK